MKPPLKAIGNPESALCCITDETDGEFVCDSVFQHDAAYIVAAVNACHKAGLTVEQMEGDAIGKLVEAASAVTGAVSGSSKHLPVVTWREDGSPKIDSHDHCVQFAKDWADLESALRPFTPEAK